MGSVASSTGLEARADRRSTLPEVPMSAEATNAGAPGRKRGRRIDLRRLGRAALSGSGARGRLPDAIDHVAKVHRAHHPGADLDPLRRAYVLAESSHRGQMRKSGEPFITHPLAVTLILAELGAETTTLTASLLHDTVEDTEVTLDQVGGSSSAKRSAISSTASPNWRRSTTGRPPSPRPSARCWWPPATTSA
ncbi:hypothetical protein GCM10020000_20970 [Streptomyces olivoverticillatus]